MSIEQFEWRTLVIDVIPPGERCPEDTLCPDNGDEDDTICPPPAESITIIRGGIPPEVVREILEGMPMDRPLRLILRPEPHQVEAYRNIVAGLSQQG